MFQGALNRMDGVTAIKGFYTFNSKNNMIVESFIYAYSFVVGVSAIPMKLLFRKNLGERSFSPFALLVSVAFLGYCGWYVGIGMALFTDVKIVKGDPTNSFLWLYGVIISPLGFAAFYTLRKGVKHFHQVFENTKKTIVGYSFYRGESINYEDLKGSKWFGLELTDQYIRMIIEPLASLRLGGILFIVPFILVSIIYTYEIKTGLFVLMLISYTSSLGLIILFSSICLFLEEFGIYMKIRGAVLDIIDGEYDMAFLSKERAKLTTNFQDELQTSANPSFEVGEAIIFQKKQSGTKEITDPFGEEIQRITDYFLNKN